MSEFQRDPMKKYILTEAQCETLMGMADADFNAGLYEMLNALPVFTPITIVMEQNTAPSHTGCAQAAINSVAGDEPRTSSEKIGCVQHDCAECKARADAPSTSQPLGALVEVRWDDSPWSRYGLFNSVEIAEATKRHLENDDKEARVVPLCSIALAAPSTSPTDDEMLAAFNSCEKVIDGLHAVFQLAAPSASHSRGDVIRMAREAGLSDPGYTRNYWTALPFQLERFAALIASRKPITKTRIGNYLRKHEYGDVAMYRNGFKDGIAYAEAAIEGGA